MIGQQKKDDSRVFHEADEENACVGRGCMHMHKYVGVACLRAALPLQRLVLEASSAAALCRDCVLAGAARGSQEGPSPSHSLALDDAHPPTPLHPPSLSSGFKDFSRQTGIFFCLAYSTYRCITWAGNIHIFFLCISPK